MARLVFVFAFVASVLLPVLASPVCGQVVWYVDDNAPNDPGPGDPSISDPSENGTVAHPFDRVQEGIAAAAVGDSVRVSSGTYVETVNLLGKAITLESASGAASTMIDAQGAGSVISCVQGEGFQTVIDGFTFQGGTGTNLSGYPIINGGSAGGGMFIWSASPTVRNCIFVSNDATAAVAGAGYGGGLAVFFESSPLITNCEISSNAAYGAINGYGGGVFVSDSSHPILINCRLEDNDADGHFNGFGGGIGIQSASSPVLLDCVFVNNHVDGDTLIGYGGGAFVGNGGANDPYFIGCRFYGNRSEQYGGGIYFNDVSTAVAIDDCVFDGNTAVLAGGAIYADNSSILLVSETRFCDNSPQHVSGVWQDLGGNSFSASACCPADVDYSETVNVIDLLAVINGWGPCPAPPATCAADTDESGTIDVGDLLAVINGWGSCP